jgi:undecaprenyl-diphosphatase
LIICLAAFGLFAVIAWNVQQQTWLTRLDDRIALYLHDVNQSLPHITAFVAWATDLGNRNVLLAGISAIGIVVLWRWPRRWFVPLIWFVILLGGHGLMHIFKEVFHRPRPLAARTWASWSFPSGHTSDATINYGMLAYLLVLVLPQRWARIGAVLGLVSVILFVGFSRMYLTVHYFSDVLGGFALGACWLAAWIAVIETVRTLGNRWPRPGNGDTTR